MQMFIDSSIIPNSPQVETTQMFIMVNGKTEYGLSTLYNIIWQYKEMKSWYMFIHVKTWMNFEKIMLSERNQSQKTTCCMIPFIWSVQNRQIYRDRK